MRRRFGCLVVVAAVLVPLVPTGAGAASTLSLSRMGAVSHRMGGVYAGTGPKEAYSSPALADVTGDSVPEIIVASMDGTVEAFRSSDRVRLWSRDLGNTAIQASPTIAELSGDGKPDVVVATMDGRVVMLDGPSGKVYRTFRQGAPLHCPAGQDCRPDGFFASPAVADINGDGIKDIIAPSYDHTVYAWSKTGPLLWRRFLEDTLWSSPVVADLDRDGRPEIILGGDIWAGNPLGKPAGGLVWVLRRDGSTYPGYPRSVPGEAVWSSPAVADLNGDKYPDIVVGTGANWPEPAGRKVYAMTGKTGGALPGWPVSVDGQVMGSPAIGDIDADGSLDVVVAANNGWVYAYTQGGRRKWRACGGNGSCPSGTTKAGAVIADLDGDGYQEVISKLEQTLKVFDGKTGALETSYSFGGVTSGSSPAVAEVGGQAVIAQVAITKTGGSQWYPETGDTTEVTLLTTGRGLCRTDWPQFHRDGARTGQWRNTYDPWTPFTCPADFVAQQYRDFLGRAVDGSGSAYWTAKLHAGTTGSTVIRSFMGSNEFGRVVAPVMRAWLATHGTYPPTAATITDAVARTRNGEPIAAIADTYAGVTPASSLSDTAFITALYRNVYKRDPSAAELTTDLGHLAGGTSRGTLAVLYAESSIGSSRLAPEVNVAMTYLGMLGRAPDPSGWTYWVPRAKKSVDGLVSGFQHSSEYKRRVT